GSGPAARNRRWSWPNAPSAVAREMRTPTAGSLRRIRRSRGARAARYPELQRLSCSQQGGPSCDLIALQRTQNGFSEGIDGYIAGEELLHHGAEQEGTGALERAI